MALRPLLWARRAAHSENLRALRPACLAAKDRPKRHVFADQSQGELRGLRSLPAGKAGKDDARPLVSIDSTDRISRGLLPAQSANPQGAGGSRETRSMSYPPCVAASFTRGRGNDLNDPARHANQDRHTRTLAVRRRPGILQRRTVQNVRSVAAP